MDHRHPYGLSWRRDLLTIAPGLLVFLVAATHRLHTPGVYMDAVNPDYLVVRLLYGATGPVWTLPGSLILDKFPLLIQLYHGALPYWIGLPVYAVAGTGIVGIRLANALFGSLVLLGAGLVLRSFKVDRRIAAVALIALALDPAFLFSFRTQFYITLLPLALVLGSVSLVERAAHHPNRWTSILAGLLAGLAVYGYFIFLFLIPALAIHALRSTYHSLAWAGGLLAGLLPYPIGYALVVVAMGGWPQSLAFLHGTLTQLAPAGAPLSLADRVAFFASMARQAVLAVGPETIMLGSAMPPALATAKLLLLLGIPALGVVAAVVGGKQRRGIGLIAGFILGLLGLYLVFGTRLWLHHLAMLSPLLTIAAAMTLGAVSRRRWQATLAAIPLLIGAAGNLVDDSRVFARLQRTGGVGLASDAIERFATEIARDPDPVTAFFPDWGVFIPFVMITHGRVPYRWEFEPRMAHDALCAGRDAVLVVLSDKAPERLPGWIVAVGAGSPESTINSQRDGVPVLHSLRWRSKPTLPSLSCP